MIIDFINYYIQSKIKVKISKFVKILDKVYHHLFIGVEVLQLYPRSFVQG